MADEKTPEQIAAEEYGEHPDLVAQDATRDRSVAPVENKPDPIDTALLDRAEEFGLSTDGFTNEQLEATLDQFDLYAETMEPEQTAPAKPDLPAAAGAKFNLPDDVDPDVAAAFKGLRDELGKMQAELKNITGQVTVGEDRARASRIDSHITTQVTRYGDPAKKLFASQHARKVIASKMKVLASGYQSENLRVPAEAKLFLDAVRSTLGVGYDKMLTEAAAAKVEGRQRQFLARGDSRKTTPADSTQAAVQAVGAAMQELGIVPDYQADRPPDDPGL